jgi:hypothetical protein
MEEKCYRDLQTQSGIAGFGIFEIMALLIVPVLLFAVFTLMNLNFIYILGTEIMLLVIFRMANNISPFQHGLISFIASNFLWPKKLSAFKLQEQDYFIKEE